MKPPITTKQAFSHPSVELAVGTFAEIIEARNAKIEELLAAMQERDAEIVCRTDIEATLIERANKATRKLEAQRKVLEQALEAFENISTADSDCDEQTQREDDSVQDAITAIQEQLA